MPASAPELLEKFEAVEAYRRLPWPKKLAAQPFKTLSNSAAMRLIRLLSMGGRYVEQKAELFFGGDMAVLIPTGYNDVWLHGASVDSDAETRFTKFLLRRLKPGMNFFDVGSCLGFYALLAAQLVENGAVHAFEPSPNLLPILRRNLAGRANAVVVGKAVSNFSGKTPFHVAPLPYIGTSSMRSDWVKLKTQPAVVDAVTLDEYCAAAAVYPDVMKLDVEGAEDQILRGAHLLLREKRPIIAMELFTAPIDSDKRAVALLEKAGYRPYAISADGNLEALEFSGLESYLAGMQARYRVIQDSINDFDNLVFLPGGA